MSLTSVISAKYFLSKPHSSFIRKILTFQDLLVCKLPTTRGLPSVYVHVNHSSTTSGNLKYTVGEIMKKWNQEFVDKNIPEPVESVEYILAHSLQIKKVRILKNVLIYFLFYFSLTIQFNYVLKIKKFSLPT